MLFLLNLISQPVIYYRYKCVGMDAHCGCVHMWPAGEHVPFSRELIIQPTSSVMNFFIYDFFFLQVM